MQQTAREEEPYLNERWQQQRDYYSRQSARNKSWHQSLLLFSTVGAIIVPVLLNITAVPKLLPTALSVLVAVAIALDTVYHFGDNWRAFRQALEALKRERVYYENRVGPYADTDTPFSLFVQTCEAIVSEESKSYFEIHRPQKRENK
jgi:hypothetical protein